MYGSCKNTFIILAPRIAPKAVTTKREEPVVLEPLLEPSMLSRLDISMPKV